MSSNQTVRCEFYSLCSGCSAQDLVERISWDACLGGDEGPVSCVEGRRSLGMFDESLIKSRISQMKSFSGRNSVVAPSCLARLPPSISLYSFRNPEIECAEGQESHEHDISCASCRVSAACSQVSSLPVVIQSQNQQMLIITLSSSPPAIRL